MTLAEFGSIPRRGLVYFGILAAVAAAVDLATWPHRLNYAAADYAMLGVVVATWVVAAYMISMSMVERPPSLGGFARFLVASLALASLPIAGIAALLAGAGALAALGVALIGMGVVSGALLVGWPILEATSQKLIGPLRAIGMAKGIRRQLFFAWLIMGGLTRSLPATSTAEDFGTAILLATVNALASTLVSMIALSLAVAAYKFMSARMPVPPVRRQG